MAVFSPTPQYTPGYPPIDPQTLQQLAGASFAPQQSPAAQPLPGMDSFTPAGGQASVAPAPEVATPYTMNESGFVYNPNASAITNSNSRNWLAIAAGVGLAGVAGFFLKKHFSAPSAESLKDTFGSIKEKITGLDSSATHEVVGEHTTNLKEHLEALKQHLGEKFEPLKKHFTPLEESIDKVSTAKEGSTSVDEGALKALHTHLNDFETHVISGDALKE